jgi:ATP-binding cassette subfamily C protein
MVSAVLNVLYLTGSLFMLEVYDRVLPSRNIPTLLALSALALGLYTFQGLLDVIRGRVLLRIGSWLDEALGSRAYELIAVGPAGTRPGGDILQPLRDLDQVRAFLSGPGPTAFFDLPWMPVYLGICYLFHPLLGLTALAGGLVLVALAVMTDWLTRAPTRRATEQMAARNALAAASHRNSEVLRAMGMSAPMTARWVDMSAECLASQQRAADIGVSLGAISRALRLMLQSAVLGVGAFLVIRQEATAGIIIAGSILTARALAPVEQAIAHWKGFVAARQSWQRFAWLSAAFPRPGPRTALPRPRATLSVEAVSVVPPGGRRLVVQDASFALKAGQALGIVGASASGKSSLVRAIVGVWPPVRGAVRLDDAPLEHWASDALGHHIGYLPQDVELFSGTVAQNIARFARKPDSAAVVAAAEAAGVHALILRLPDGYETLVGEGGAYLSAGQRQRLALARALYGNPFLVVLDEPNSNLDAEGDEALAAAILGIRARDGIAIVVAHRTSALAIVDEVLVLAEGRVQALGPKDQILGRLVGQRSPRPAPLKVVMEAPQP